MVDVRNGIVAYGWVDGNPVHFITTASGFMVTNVGRKIGGVMQQFIEPLAFKNYNDRIGGVDHHDQLRELCPLSKRHGFQKYYVKMALDLFAAMGTWMQGQGGCQTNTSRANSVHTD